MRGVIAPPLRLGALLLALACAHPAAAAPSEGATETVEQAVACRCRS
jgi:hypothetical protein